MAVSKYSITYFTVYKGVDNKTYLQNYYLDNLIIIKIVILY